MEEKERKPFVWRLRGLGLVVIIVFLILGFNLWRLQIKEYPYYAAMAKGNVMQTVSIPATRGDIRDRNGELLATSVPQFALTIDWLDLQQAKNYNWKDVIARLAGYIKPYWTNKAESVQSITEDILVIIQDHQWERYRPVTILQNVPQNLQAIIAEHQDELPGVSIEAVPVRYYPDQTLAGQVLGYVRQISQSEIAQFNQNPEAKKEGFQYQQGDLVGKMGVEKSYDIWLRGKEGVEQVEVDNNARPISSKIIQEPQPGDTVYLTLDANLQRAVGKSLDSVIKTIQQVHPNAQSGAAVVIDVNTGKILAMVSRPAMNPNDLIGNISQQVANKYFVNQNAASLNRAISGVYPPGSTFKMITAMAALKSGATNPNETINDVLSSLGNADAQKSGFPEWGGNNFGLVNIYKAIAFSSDIYFQVIGRRVFDNNPELIKQIANEFGLGVDSGVDLPGEAKGTAPSPEWKKAYYAPYYKTLLKDQLASLDKTYAAKIAQASDPKTKQQLQQELDQQKQQATNQYNQTLNWNLSWQMYDSYNNAIGQGFNDYTPLQLANYVATIVNGGKRYRPYIVDKITNPLTGKVVFQNKPQVLNTVSVSPQILAVIKQAMQDTTTFGTGASIFSNVPQYSGGGKTGTAQIGNKNTVAGNLYNGMYVAFAPYDHPQIAFAAVVAYGGEGYNTAGAVAKAAFMQYFGWK